MAPARSTAILLEQPREFSAVRSCCHVVYCQYKLVPSCLDKWSPLTSWTCMHTRSLRQVAWKIADLSVISLSLYIYVYILQSVEVRMSALQREGEYCRE